MGCLFDQFDISQRTKNALMRSGIDTVEKIMSISANDLYQIRNMGKKSVEEVLHLQNMIKDEFVGLQVQDDCSVKIQEKSLLLERMFPYFEHSCFTVMFRDQYENVVSDINIDSVNFSVRTYNALSEAGYSTVKEIALEKYEKLREIRNLGTKSIKEIEDYIEKHAFIISNEEYGLFNDINSFFSDVILVDDNYYKNEILKLIQKNLSDNQMISITMDERLLFNSDFIEKIMNKHEIKNVYKSYLMMKISRGEEKLFEEEDYLFRIGLYRNAISELVSEKRIEYIDYIYRIRFPRITEWINSIEKDSQRKALNMRIHGKTLEECGQEMGLTRERVRQIVKKAIMHKPRLKEDDYAYWFEKYNISLDAFISIFKEERYVYEYLYLMYSRGEIDIEDIVDDERITSDVYANAMKYINRKKINVFGEYVLCKRELLVKKIAENICADTDITSEDLYKHYNDFLDKNDLSCNEKLLFPSMRAFEARVENSDYILVKYGKRMRYYPITEIDISDFINRLNLNQYNNIEISTQKIIYDNTELMNEYDIRDEYELHNLLKKTERKWNEDSSFDVNFGRMPLISFGKADRKKQIIDLLLQISPVGIEDYCKFYEMEYGVHERTVAANFAPELSDYYHDGIYSVNQIVLDEKELSYMKESLSELFYFLDDVKQIYMQAFPDGDATKINTISLKELGFRFYAEYVIKDTFSSSYDYFRFYLTKDDMIDLKNQDKRFSYVQIQNAVLDELRTSYELIEYEDMKFISYSRFQNVYPDITKDTIKQYVETAIDFAKDEPFFTVKMLKDKGFHHRLLDVSLPEWFSAALIKNSKKIRFVKTGGNIVFSNEKHQIKTLDLIRYILENNKMMGIYDFVNYLNYEYGLEIEKNKIIQLISSTNMYYDSTMEKAYYSKDYYYDEI